MEYKAIYIGGTGRSGSNILKQVLSEHPDIYSLPFEPRYLLDPDGIFDFYKSSQYWSPYIVDFKIRRLQRILNQLAARSPEDLEYITNKSNDYRDHQELTPPRYYAWELNKHIPGFSKNSKRLITDILEFSYNNYWCGSESGIRNNISLFSSYEKLATLPEKLINFIDRNITNMLISNRCKVYLDDSTFNILHAPEIFELCLNSNLLHIYRDPRDVINSYLNQSWSPNDLSQAIHWYKSIISRWDVIKRDLPGDFFIEIKFENFVLHFEDTISKLEEFLKIGLDKIRYKGILNKDYIGKWQRELNTEEIRYLNSELSDELKSLGYSQ